ncbi:MAG: PAS domain S-box protein [Anaerolineae bacterium]
MTNHKKEASEQTDAISTVHSTDLDHFFMSALDLLTIANMEGYFLKVNQEWEAVLGYTVEELTGTNFLDYVHPDDLQPTLDAIAILSDDKPVLNFINRYRTKSGDYRFIEWRSHPHNNLIYASARDITERQQIEARLESSERQYRLLAENINDMVTLHHPDGRFIYASPSYLRATGYTETELLALSVEQLSQLVHPHDLQLTRDEAHQQVLQGEQVIKLQYRRRRKDGSYFWVEAVSTPILDEQGQVVQLLASTRDISDRKQAEDALRQSEERLRLALSASGITLAQCDRDLRYIWIQNPHPDFDALSVIGKRDDELNDHAGSDQLMALKRDVLQSGKIRETEITFALSEGDVTYSFVASPMQDTEGEIIGVTTGAVDITVIKQIQQREFDLQLEQERMNLLRQFIEHASHEFRTPLTIISSSAQLMARMDSLQSRVKKLDVIMAQITRMTRLIEGMITMTKLRRPITLEITTVSIKDLLKTLCYKLTHTYSDTMQIACDVQPNLPGIQGDEAYLLEALEQIIDNACRYTPAGGTVTIHAVFDTDGLRILVQDTGMGMSLDDQKHVFDTFWRRDKAHTTPGLGLGLSIAHLIIEKHGGYIEIESAVDVGTTVTVYLPVITPDASQDI